VGDASRSAVARSSRSVPKTVTARLRKKPGSNRECLVMCDLCRQAMSPSIAGRRPLVGDPLKIFVECDVALDTSLVSRDGSFEEIGELLDILELHETERVLGAELLGEAELHEALIGAEL
jgi:hypothetical protein